MLPGTVKPLYWTPESHVTLYGRYTRIIIIIFFFKAQSQVQPHTYISYEGVSQVMPSGPKQERESGRQPPPHGVPSDKPGGT